MQPLVEILPNKAALVARAQALVIAKVQAAVATRHRCHLVLSGGSTPEPLYAALATADLPWHQLYIYWGDERFVPDSHPDSNARMARSVWLDQVPIPPEQIFAVPTEAGTPEAVAQHYEQTLRQCFPPETLPQFDLILLGMGDDGHTASLFPHTSALTEQKRWVTVGHKDGQPRITLTAPLINQAHTVLFLVAGASKQTALSQVLAPVADEVTYPARLIHPQGELRWLLDQAAADGLPENGTFQIVANS
jgi:6-phosphogluconolactonase